MLDQSFTYKTFEKIFLRENRKGIFHKKFFPDEYFEIHKKFKITLSEKMNLLKERELSKEEIKEFAERLDSFNLAKEHIRNQLFRKAGEEILEKNFSFKISYDKKRELFQTNNECISIYYAIKKLQININKTFKVKQSNRNEIIEQVYKLLSDGFPKVLIKTDIKKFYESIPQKELLNKLENTTILSPFSIKLIKKILFEFNSCKDKRKIKPEKGIPRGIGISAYLSELYLRDFDNQVAKLPHLTFYSRYVDDIILIFTPPIPSKKRNYLNEVKSIASKQSIFLNTSRQKTMQTSLLHVKGQSKDIKFAYLGYEFNLKLTNANTNLNLEIASKKMKKYEGRITKSIIAYNNEAKRNEKTARKLLFLRMKYLTGNFELNGSKKGLKSGIYYSNAKLILNKYSYNIKSLKHLDNKLKGILNTNLKPPVGCITKENLKNYIISHFSFQSGFQNRKKNFYSFKSTIRDIESSNLKYGFNVSKFDRITSVWNHE